MDSIGAVVSVAGAFLAPDSFYSAYLIGYMFWLGLALGCMAILMLYHLVGGAWGTVIRRILESGMMTLPMMFVLFLPILFHLPRLYSWARPDGLADAKIADIAHSYLNFNGILIRYVVYFAIWIGMAYFLNRWSTEQDSIAGQSTLRFRAMSSIGLVIYSLTISFAVIDWVMSLQARWISTIYGLLFIAGEALSAFCFVVVIESILGKRKPMSEYLTDTEIHDHGKLMLAFVMVWAYFNFSQWLIIWAGNLPEEIPWYVRRLNGGWENVGLFPRGIPLRRAVRAVALAPVEAQGAHSGPARFMAHLHAHRRYLLAYRAGVASHVSPQLAAFHDRRRNRRPLDGLLLPQPEIASAAACQRAADPETSGAVAWVTKHG